MGIRRLKQSIHQPFDRCVSALHLLHVFFHANHCHTMKGIGYDRNWLKPIADGGDRTLATSHHILPVMHR